MAKIVDLQSYRAQQINHRVFGPWKRRFSEIYDETTRPSDLSGRTLLYLAQPGDASTLGFYEVIMGVFDLGMATAFYDLDKSNQLKVIEAHLFLADQIRFELMRRLDWITRFVCQKDTLVTLIENAEKLKIQNRVIPPELSPSHSGYTEFQDLTPRDKEAFVRRLLPEAIESFRRTID